MRITQKANYRKLGNATDEDLTTDPNRPLNTDIALKIMFTGMTMGLFTGKKLEDFFQGDVTELKMRERSSMVWKAPIWWQAMPLNSMWL